MASDDRFYLLKMKNREVLWGDVGSLVRLEGVVIGGGESMAVLMLPGAPIDAFKKKLEVYSPTLQEWSDWLRQSDNPEILVGPTPNGSGATLPKVFHRKLRYEISGAVQQKIWARDNFKCVFCDAQMGKVLLTVDHLVPLELGGANDTSNYVTACKPCNKRKGSRDSLEFLSTCGLYSLLEPKEAFRIIKDNLTHHNERLKI